MRLLLVNTRHFPGGGDSRYTLSLGALLREKGHEVAFLSMDDKRNVPGQNSDLFVSNIDFRDLNRKKNPIAGLQVLWRSIYSVEAKKRFGNLVNRFKPDAIHLNNIHAHITPSVIFEAKRHGLHVVWTLHDYKLICPNSHFLIDNTGEVCEACGKKSYYHAVLKRCKKGSLLASAMATLEAYAHVLMAVRRHIDAYMVASTFLRHKLIERDFPLEKVHHLPYFLPARMFNCCDTNKGYILFFGRLVAIKGIYSLIEACQLVPKVRAILVGQVEAPLSGKLRALLPPNARYLGLVPDVELYRILSGAAAVVLPSMVYESQPFSILEAFACGKPVIASNLGGMTELVKDGERGILVPPGDVKALADAMKWMVSHPREAAKMGRAAREYALREHNAETHYQRLMEIYKKVLN